MFRAIARHGGVGAEREAELLEALLAKDGASLIELTGALDEAPRAALRLLPELYGGAEVIERARAQLPRYPEIGAALDDLATLVRENGAAVSIDLADLRGYRYHSGVVFAAYCAGLPSAIALGGRYDEVGKAFGRARPATGFSMDVRQVVRVAATPPRRGAILAPHGRDPGLTAAIERLRRAGEVVIVELPGHESARAELACDRQLVKRADKWEVEGL